MIMKTLTLILILMPGAALVSAPLPAMAVTDSYDYAEVIAADPVVETIQVEAPREECWIERRPASSAGWGNSVTPEIVGVLLGGAIGYQFGSGRGQDVATVAGAVLGGSVGHDLKVRNSRQSAVYENVERCQVVSDYNTEERIIAYDVAYRYNGQVYRTTMDHDPGERVRVAIRVNVVE
jgi:uncharacterized protein YcfJ